ncbi:MAG: hypothetical protein QOJ07_2768 [Thermoleophilaceae bacterium]|nr:hypothetical protein [Thermoleophilaceae bacterium]
MKRLLATVLIAGAGAVAAVPTPASADGGAGALVSTYGNCGTLAATGLSSRYSSELDVLASGPDGGVAGAGASNTNLVVMRLRPDGSPDPAFGAGGTAVVPVGRQVGVTGVALGASGNVVVQAGYFGEADNNRHTMLVRLRPDGTLDPTFGGGSGILLDSLPAAGDSDAGKIALTPAEEIVATGDADGHMAVARYTPAGTLDPTFGTGGIASPTGDTPFSSALAVALLDDGDLIVTGHANRSLAVARLNADGTSDGAFGTNGVQLATPPAGAEARSIVIYGDGRIVVAGYGNNINGDQLLLARYTDAGQLDPTFGNGGFVFGPDIGAARFGDVGLALRADGSLLTSGAYPAAGFGPVGLASFGSDGSVDTGFGVAGFSAFDFQAQQLRDLVLLPDGSALAASSLNYISAVSRFADTGDALAAAAVQPVACQGAVATKTITQLLKTGKGARYGKLRVVPKLVQAGSVHLTAKVTTGGRSAPIPAINFQSDTGGSRSIELPLSAIDKRLLRTARSASVSFTVSGTNGGGAAATFTKTLKR